MRALRRRTTVQARQRRRHLRLMRPIGVAQYEAEVGIGDQPPMPVDDISIAATPDLHCADQVPDKLQIDLGNGDAGVMPGMRDRDRHIGFRLIAELAPG